MEEIWKDIAGYEGLYQVSNLGRVRSLTKRTSFGVYDRIRIMKVSYTKDGYAKYTFNIGNKSTTRLAHRIVAETFIPNVLNLEQINHKNFDKSDNNVENLEWVTREENMRHSFEGGHHCQKGSKNTQSILTENDIPLIRKLRKEYKLKLSTIALVFGVNISTIKGVVYGNNWGHIKEAL